jgi:hypothetical protein
MPVPEPDRKKKKKKKKKKKTWHAHPRCELLERPPREQFRHARPQQQRVHVLQQRPLGHAREVAPGAEGLASKAAGRKKGKHDLDCQPHRKVKSEEVILRGVGILKCCDFEVLRCRLAGIKILAPEKKKFGARSGSIFFVFVFLFFVLCSFPLPMFLPLCLLTCLLIMYLFVCLLCTRKTDGQPPNLNTFFFLFFFFFFLSPSLSLSLFPLRNEKKRCVPWCF